MRRLARPRRRFRKRFHDLFGLAVIFGLVNGAMILLVAQLSDSLDFDQDFFASLFSATLAALVISVVSPVLSKLPPDGR